MTDYMFTWVKRERPKKSATLEDVMEKYRRAVPTLRKAGPDRIMRWILTKPKPETVTQLEMWMFIITMVVDGEFNISPYLYGTKRKEGIEDDLLEG